MHTTLHLYERLYPKGGHLYVGLFRFDISAFFSILGCISVGLNQRIAMLLCCIVMSLLCCVLLC